MSEDDVIQMLRAADRIEALERELEIAKATANILAGDYEELPDNE